MFGRFPRWMEALRRAILAQGSRRIAGGLVLVLAVGLSVGAALGSPRPERGPAAHGRPSSARTTGGLPFAGMFLVYGRHALGADQVRALSRAIARPVVAVNGGEVAVASGRRDFPVVPVLMFTVDATAYARAAGSPGLARSLESGLVLSRTGAALRHSGTGGHVVLADGRTLPVSAVVDDHLLGGFEMATTTRVLGRPAGRLASYVLVPQGPEPVVTTASLRRALPALDLRIVSRTRNGYLSSADSVLTQAQIKSRFGEFALGSEASARPDSAWERKWITTTRVPQLGRITCNRAVVGALRAAMTEVTNRGLGASVHTADFQRQGGCWSPRLVRFGAGQLSAHTWGIAVDINVDDNPLGARPVQDPRLVDIMARHGFSWGGSWLRPDGAHFQWRGTAFR